MATPGSYTSASAPLVQSQQHPYTIQRDVSAPSAYPMMQQSPAPSQMMSPTKDLNVVNMCRTGQEIVHDIVSKAQDMFTSLGKNMQLPNNVTFHGQTYAERKAKLDEQVRQITMNFRKLRIFYSKINEACEQMEMPTDQELIPFVGAEVEKTQPYSDTYHYVVEQHRDMVEQVRLKNHQLKEVIDSMRSIIWEINTMITMRKTG
ncbi:hypothetical protein BsWGS_14151 [Bradybaena similaris]